MADGLGGAACRAAGHRGLVFACAQHPGTSGTRDRGGAGRPRPGANGARRDALTEPGANLDPQPSAADARAPGAGAAAQCAARANAAAATPAASACGCTNACATKPSATHAACAGTCAKPGAFARAARDTADANAAANTAAATGGAAAAPGTAPTLAAAPGTAAA